MSTLRFCVIILVMNASLPRVEGIDFFVITNKPELGRNSDEVLYQYAITTDPAVKDALEVSKDDKLVRNARLRNLVRKSDSLSYGVYLTSRRPNKSGGMRYGVYQWSANGETINTFVKPVTEKLDTKGVYTITAYRDSDDSSMLSSPITFGVDCKMRSQSIKWNRGRRREFNTGPTVTLTEVKGSAGIYEIFRGTRRRRDWSVFVEVIVSDCELGKYTSVGPCLSICQKCQAGGVCAQDRDLCICPPFMRGETCKYQNAWLRRPGTSDYYYIGANTLNFVDARSACQNLGGDLASVTSAGENHFIDDLLDDFPDISSDLQVLLGLTYNPNTGDGVWADGTELAYANWNTAGGQPLNSPPIFTVGAMETTGDGKGFWRNVQSSFPSAYVCERKRVKDPLIIETENAITCGEIPGGNNRCKGYHFCYGDLYGCSCASGWRGNACDQACKTGTYGPGCSLRCIEEAGCPDKQCDRFTGRCSYSLF